MNMNKMLDSKVKKVERVGMVETGWDCYYDYYKDLSGNYYGDLDDDHHNFMELHATTAEEAEAEMKEYVAELAAEMEEV